MTASPLPLFPVRREHLAVLMTDTGIMQHAKGSVPDPRHGYCTDDVARALLVDLLHGHEIGWQAVEGSAARHVRFLAQALDTSGRFRNLRSADGTWLDEPRSEDANARALHALGQTIASAPPGEVRSNASTIFGQALHVASRVHSIRPMAAVALACRSLMRTDGHDGVMSVYTRVARELLTEFETCRSDPDWPWPESVLTYENELPAQALIVCGKEFEYPRMTRLGLDILDWLVEIQTAPEGHLSSVGNAGWWPRRGQKARFDQQPVSAVSLVLAADAAYEATGEPHYGDVMEMGYAWFLGRNDVDQWIAEPATGACRDGIGPAGASVNRGAESTIAWNLTLEHIRRLRSPRS